MNDAAVERRLSTILAADVVGYSRLVGRDEEGTITGVKAHITELIEPKAVQYRGRIVKLMGDGILMEFVSVVDAILFAVEMQGAVALGNDGIPEDRQIVYRIGINIREVIVDGDDIHGDGVNIAARLESLAEPGGIYISDAAYSQVRGKLDLNFEQLGEHQVKNIAQPISVCRVIMDDKASSRMTEIQRIKEKRNTRLPLMVAAGIVLAVIIGGIGWWQYQGSQPVVVEETALKLPNKPSVVVLPLKNLSDETNQGGLAKAISEDITTELSRFAGLFVISPDSANFYDSKQKSVRQIGRELGIRYVLTGSMQRAGERLRVTMQLIEAATEVQIWTERYDRTMTDVFVVQDEIVQAVVTEMGETIWRSAAARLEAKPLANFEAYDYFLKAQEVFHKLTRESTIETRRIFEKAKALDPNLGLIYYGFAWTYYMDYRAQWVATGGEALDKATA